MVGLRFIIAIVGVVFALPSFARNESAISTITIENNQRVEDSTVLSYMTLNEGEDYSSEQASLSIKRLFETGLFSDVAVKRDGEKVEVVVQENPIINRVDFEGNKRIKDDELLQETSLDSRSVYTRARVQSDVKRILELYRQRGRYAVEVVP
jgi:outer membrane protein insertion porin family